MPPALGRQPCFKDSFLTAVARAGPRERKDKQETERLFIKLTGSVRNKGGLLSNVQTSREPGEQRKLVPVCQESLGGQVTILHPLVKKRRNPTSAT